MHKTEINNTEEPQNTANVLLKWSKLNDMELNSQKKLKNLLYRVQPCNKTQHQSKQIM